MEEVSWQLIFPPFAASRQSQRVLETFPPQNQARHVFVTEPLQLCWINIREENIPVPKNTSYRWTCPHGVVNTSFSLGRKETIVDNWSITAKKEVIVWLSI